MNKKYASENRSKTGKRIKEKNFIVRGTRFIVYFMIVIQQFLFTKPDNLQSLFNFSTLKTSLFEVGLQHFYIFKTVDTSKKVTSRMSKFQDLMQKAIAVKNGQMLEKRRHFEQQPQFVQAGLHYIEKFREVRRQAFS